MIEPDSLQCPCGCGEMVRIGEDRTERLDIVPARFRVIETIRPRYACRTCQEGVHQAPAPVHLIEGAMPTEAMIAHVLVSKYADHLPLYRQTQIYHRAGIDTGENIKLDRARKLDQLLTYATEQIGHVAPEQAFQNMTWKNVG